MENGLWKWKMTQDLKTVNKLGSFYPSKVILIKLKYDVKQHIF